MSVRDPRIDAYIAKARPFAQPILKRFRAAVHAGCPGVTETIKWSVPAFDYKGPFAGMAAFKAHCIYGFWKGKLMKGAGVPFTRVATIDDLPSESALVKRVREAKALSDAGVKAPRVVKARPALKTPADMLAAIRKNRKAQTAYDAFSPSHKREYVEWITGAKTGETRARRIDTAVQWMAEGKSRNWKYVPGAKTAPAR